MRNFIGFLEECKEEYNHHQQSVKSTFESGWKQILELYRNEKTLPDVKMYKNIELSGLDKYKLTDEEAFFILSFTGSNSSWVNHPLRNGYPFETKCKEYFANNLDQVLEKIPSYNDRYVFRSDMPSGETPEVLNWFNNNIGGVVVTPYFLSTSKDNFENTDIAWRIKTLLNNSMGKDLGLLTNNIPEKEVLFKRNAYFKVKEVDFESRIVEMEEVLASEKSVKLIGFYFSNNSSGNW